MIVLIGIAIAAFAVVGILASGADAPTKHAKGDTAAELAPAADPLAFADSNELSLEDATSLVEEARTLMLEARWDESIDRLATIPEEFRDVTGAITLQTELEENRARYMELRAEVDAAVEAQQWREARTLLASLVEIAEHDSSLIELGATIDDAEAAANAPAERSATERGTDAKQDPTKQPAARGGGGTKPAAVTKPAVATKPAIATKPAVATKPTGSGTVKPSGTAKPAGTGAGAGVDIGEIGGALTPAQQAALEAMLAGAIASSGAAA